MEELRKRFAQDRFATVAAGAVIDDVDVDCAVVSMQIGDVHRNASGGVMGGAIFTLADFAFAVASNQEDRLVVTVSSNILYVGAAHGSRLIATATPDRIGKSMCFYTVRIVDDEGGLVAIVTVAGKRTDVELQ